MIRCLLFIILSLLIVRVFLDYSEGLENKKATIEDLKWPFLNIKDENYKKVDIVCIRGPLEQQKDHDLFDKFKKENKLIIGCSSYLSFPIKAENKLVSYKNFFHKGKRIDELVDGWVHPFRESKYIKNKNTLLLSESDFSDNIEKLKNFDPSTKKIKYDFICYCPSDETCDGGWNYHNKNWPLAKKTIEVACNKLNLKGVLIGRENCEVNVKDENLERHEKLEFYSFIEKISQSKFMIIQNYEDASPRVVTEALLVDTPILMNKDILGGWKYINSQTGVFYDENDIEEKIKIILKTKYSPRKYFVKHHGIDISGKKFRDFIVKIDPSYSKHRILRFSVS